MQPFPPWFKKEIPTDPHYFRIRDGLAKARLNTVCKEARCPNIGECYAQGKMTFMILGDRCTRTCGFCNIKKGRPQPVDEDENRRIVETVKTLDLNYVVITMVTRDDLPDGGSGIFAQLIQDIKATKPSVRVEVLVSDFLGNLDAVSAIVAASPDVFNHNLETVPALYSTVRKDADFERSLSVLRFAKDSDCHILTKSGIMLGLGESESAIYDVCRKLRDTGCDILTLGQYLQPNPYALPVVNFITPEVFDACRDMAQGLGFRYVFSGPLVRSSYHAADIFSETESHTDACKQHVLER